MLKTSLSATQFGGGGGGGGGGGVVGGVVNKVGVVNINWAWSKFFTCDYLF